MKESFSFEKEGGTKAKNNLKEQSSLHIYHFYTNRKGEDKEKWDNV